MGGRGSWDGLAFSPACAGTSASESAHLAQRKRETFGLGRDTVRRPCHNRDPLLRYARLPAAMAAGVIHELWDFERLYDDVTERTYG